jgi:hypothetical protein
MIRLLATALIVTALLPASAEAARMRFGGSSRSPHANTETHAANGSVVTVAPRLGSASKPAEAKADVPTRPPFPAAGAEPVLLKLATAEPPKSWCPSEVVVGGFCVLN